jgi:hypothetical protein
MSAHTSNGKLVMASPAPKMGDIGASSNQLRYRYLSKACPNDLAPTERQYHRAVRKPLDVVETLTRGRNSLLTRS